MTTDSVLAWPSEAVPSEGGVNQCSSVWRFGLIMKANKVLSADHAYDIGQAFYSGSSDLSTEYVRAVRHALKASEFKIRSENFEPRYRMAPAIIVDYPEVEFQTSDKHRINSRICFTVGSGTDYCKIWFRLNLEKGHRVSEAASFFREKSAEVDSIIQDFLIPKYRQLAEKVLKKIEFSTHTSIVINMFGFVDGGLNDFLKARNDNWNVFGNFCPAEKPDKRYSDVLNKLECKIRPGREARDTNFLYYRAPISRRGQFENNSKLTACSLLRVDLSSTDTNVYGLCYEYAGFAGEITNSSAHVASGELSFELGRLY